MASRALRVVGDLKVAAIVTVQLKDGHLFLQKYPAFAVLSATPWTGIFTPNVRFSQSGSYAMASTVSTTATGWKPRQIITLRR
ncbi:hypothetical protein ARMGADRAFT_573850 [Armillaria gallica]|uniref:Uncharacterized protein n=1 Tax=Armillaria gallica TaxID=47427 RepID=A0A2H3E3N6_ARMGA|nr:hypothetical protein ARMGADRAFT_573850 [Armillaria gallica]